MATSTDLSGGVLTEVSPPSIGSMGGGRVSSPSAPGALTQIAGAVSQLAPLALGLWNKSQTDDLQKGLSEQLLNISEARQNGDITAGEAETRFRQTVLQTKQANPEYLDEINAISMKTIGRNPVAEAEQSNRDQVLAAESLGGMLNFGLGKTSEENIEDGMVAIKSLRDAKMATAALTKEAAAAGRQEVLFQNAIIGISGKANAQLNPLMGDLLRASSMVNSVDGAIQTKQALTKFDTVLSNVRTATLELAMSQLEDPAFAGINRASALTSITKYIDDSQSSMKQAVKSASENGYMKLLSDKVTMLKNTTDIDVAEAAPLIYGLSQSFGSDVAAAFLTPETVSSLGPDIIKQLGKVTTKFQQVDGETQEQGINRLDAVVNVLEGKITVEELNNPADRAAILGDLGKAVVAISNNPTPNYVDKEGRTREEAFLNASGNLAGVAASIDITSTSNIKKVTDIFTSNYVDTLSKATNKAKADTIADTSVNVLFKESKLLLNEAAKSGMLEFDKTTGKVQLKSISLEDLTSEQRKGLKGQSQDQIWTASGMRRSYYQGLVTSINRNVEKQYSFKEFSPAMQNSGSLNRYAEAIHQTGTRGVPYVKGQEPSSGLGAILSKNKEELEARTSAVGKVLKTSLTSLARIDAEIVTGNFFGKKKKEEDKNPRKEPYVPFQEGADG